MIRDATQVTGLAPQAWRLNPTIAKIAAGRGLAIPSVDQTAEDAPPVVAFVNHGEWKAFCDNPICFGSAEGVWRDWPWFYCMHCGNAAVGGRWRPVELPDDLAAIESSLDGLPKQAQNWHATEPGLGGPPAYEVQEIDDDPAVFMTIEQQNRAMGLPDPTQARED
jgi:hypothetical protein